MARAHIHTALIDRGSCGGSVLILVLLFLLLLGIVASTTLHTSALQLHLAGNDQFHEEALQRARGMVVQLSQDLDSFVLQSKIGERNCGVTSITPCAWHTLPSPVVPFIADKEILDFTVERLPPLLMRAFPPRELEVKASSHSAFQAALFEIEASIDGSTSGLGVAQVARGIAIRVGEIQELGE